MGVRREVWRCLGYRRQSLVRGIRCEVYLREGRIHAFQAPSTVQEHGEERHPRDELLLANPKNSSSLEFMNNYCSDYNK
jgi:hypothetical protein